MSSAYRMLQKKDYKDITVLELVADSGVNRNTFYYHFKDMPDLMVEMAKRGLDKAFNSHRGRSDERLIHITEAVFNNREVIMHVYSSADRAVFDSCLSELCKYLAAKLYSTFAEEYERSELEKQQMLLLAKCSIFGLASDWLTRGLDEQGRDMLVSICENLVQF